MILTTRDRNGGGGTTSPASVTSHGRPNWSKGCWTGTGLPSGPCFHSVRTSTPLMSYHRLSDSRTTNSAAGCGSGSTFTTLTGTAGRARAVDGVRYSPRSVTGPVAVDSRDPQPARPPAPRPSSDRVIDFDFRMAHLG